MRGFVLDCSVAICWCIDDEAADATDALLRWAERAQVFVPFLWHIEIANVLLKAERKKRLTVAETGKRLKLLSSLPLKTDMETLGEAVWGQTTHLARSCKLTDYDAAYLELSMRKNLPLATVDKGLAAAARRSRIAVLPE